VLEVLDDGVNKGIVFCVVVDEVGVEDEVKVEDEYGCEDEVKVEDEYGCEDEVKVEDEVEVGTEAGAEFEDVLFLFLGATPNPSITFTLRLIFRRCSI
jgi:hypothetical protein